MKHVSVGDENDEISRGGLLTGGRQTTHRIGPYSGVVAAQLCTHEFDG
jgi:hypothetical protein